MGVVKQIGKGVIYDPGVYIGIVQSITERERGFMGLTISGHF